MRVNETTGSFGHDKITGTGAQVFTGPYTVLEAFGDFKFAELEGTGIALEFGVAKRYVARHSATAWDFYEGETARG